MPRKARRITSIKEIAKLADCSIATVSNALNGKGRISEQARQKIFDICQKHGYLPNSAGRNLRRRKNETIGIMFYPTCAAIFRNIYYAQIMEALESSMEAHGYDLILSGYDSSANIDEPPRILRQGKVDGIILLGRFPRQIVKQLNNFGTPMLHLDNHRDEIKIDYVTTDGFNATRKIIEHLIGLGHQRIVFMAYEFEDTNAEQREAGYLSAVMEHQLPKEHNICLREFSTSRDGYTLLKPLLKTDHSPTAVVCVNDTLAADLIGHLQEDGYGIPKDISVFGYNDDPHSVTSVPQISTVRVDKDAIGRIGAETILSRIEDPDGKPLAVRLPFELIHRDSEGPPPKP